MKKYLLPLIVIASLLLIIPIASAWTISGIATTNVSGFIASGTNTSVNISLNVTVTTTSINLSYINITCVNSTGWNFTGTGSYNSSVFSGADTTYGGGEIGGTVTSINLTNGTNADMLPGGTNSTIWFVIGVNATVEGIYTFAMNLTTNTSGTGQDVANFSNFTLELDLTKPVRTFTIPSSNDSSPAKEFTMTLTTGEIAECRYATTPRNSYTSMTLFTSTNSTSHTRSFSGDAGVTYDYYFKCMDDNQPRQNTNTDDWWLRFTPTGSGGGPGGGGTTAQKIAVPIDVLPPEEEAKPMSVVAKEGAGKVGEGIKAGIDSVVQIFRDIWEKIKDIFS